MRIVLLGPPGAGKGTLCSTLKKKFNLLHISTGDILREEMKNGTKIGKEIKKLMDSGNLVRDDLVSHLVEDIVKNVNDSGKSLMFDGYPRTIRQAKDLDRVLENLNIPLDLVLYLQSSPALIIKRLTGRRVCQDCDAVYHISNRPPKKDGVCDYCGSNRLVQRKDDCEDTIRHRMKVYHDTVTPIVEYYDKQNKLKRVDSDRDPEYVEKDLLRFVNG